jgi:hypothetical protein
MKGKATVKLNETFVSLNIRITHSTHQALKAYCEENHCLQSHAVVNILTDILKEEGMFEGKKR